MGICVIIERFLKVMFHFFKYEKYAVEVKLECQKTLFLVLNSVCKGHIYIVVCVTRSESEGKSTLLQLSLEMASVIKPLLGEMLEKDCSTWGCKSAMSRFDVV